MIHYLGVQMWVLCRFLPLMIGDMVSEDDPYWLCFLTLLKISQYLFAPKIDGDDVAYLDVLITEHHQKFCILYSDVNVIPKMHFLIHTPRLILKYVN